MTIQIRKATRKKAKLRIGMMGTSGSGKTMSSLLLAYGITGDWDKIGFIDTEEGSGELYVGHTKHNLTIGEFQYIRISKDFSPANYKAAIEAFEKAGVEVIIIDSLTHAWSGTGGILDKHGKATDRTKNSYTAWRDVTPDHNALVNAILQSPCHIIATMRSKTEYVLQENERGKMAPVKMGMAPVQRDGMEYEFTVVFDINMDSQATATKDRTDLYSIINAAGTLERRTFIISPETGEELGGWINEGKDVPQDILAAKIKDLLPECVLDHEAEKDAWILDNTSNLPKLSEEKLEGIYNYLLTKKKENDNA